MLAMEQAIPPIGEARDDYDIFLPTDIPPGDYNLLVGLYTCETLPEGDCGNGDTSLHRDPAGPCLQRRSDIGGIRGGRAPHRGG